ncbi:MAG: metallophosphoesterase family protein [Hyphomicrobium sp.]
MTTTFTLAHFSDVHLSPLIGLQPQYWTAKRALGALNWLRLRHKVHRRAIVDELVADALALNVDHIAVTGDLTNLGLPLEHAAALDWLSNVAPPNRLTVIPGNHDVYSSMRGDPGVERWAPYMGGDAATLAFPFVRRIGPLALIGLNSAVPTPPFFASGRLGGEQIDVARDLLERLRGENVIRVVLIHHPPMPGLTAPRRALGDAAHIQHVLERIGSELVLYGHNHRVRCDWLEAETGPIPVIAAASASAARTHGGDELASYNLFTFFTGDRGLRIRWIVRGLDKIGGRVTKLREQFLTPPV